MITLDYIQKMKRIYNFISLPQKGFTLIELLIVIAILGILATAVLSAINPVEQINRGRDTGTQSDAEQLLSAIMRYNAANGYFPWQTGQSDQITLTGWTKIANAAGAPDGWVIDNIIASGNVLDKLGSSAGGTQELQTSFINRILSASSRTLYVYNGGAQGNSTYVCFNPQSSSFIAQARKKWNGGVECAGAACTCIAGGTTGVPEDLQFTAAGGNWNSNTAGSTICDIATTDNRNVMYCLP